LTTTQIEAFIDDANLWVTTFLVGACTAMTTALLVAVEKYLAAHFITARDPRLRSAKLADVSETYQRADVVSEYLRTAISLDPCGIVAATFLDQDKRLPVRFRMGAGFDSDLELPTE